MHFLLFFVSKNQVTSHDLAQNLTFLHVDILNLQKIMNFQSSFSKNQVTSHDLAQNLTFLLVDILNLQQIMNFQFSFSKNKVT